MDRVSFKQTRTFVRGLVLRGALGLATIAAIACSTPADDGKDAGSTGGDTSTGTPSALSCGHEKVKGLDYKAVVGVLNESGSPVENNEVVKISVSSLSTGQFQDTRFIVTNNASPATASELRITKVEVKYTVPALPAQDGDKPGFECLVGLGGDKRASCAGYDFGLVVPPDYECAKAGDKAHTQTEIFVRFNKPADNVARAATLRIDYLLDDAKTAGSTTLFLATGVGQPKITVSPQQLDFGTVKLGASAPDKVTALNVGDAPLLITQIDFAPNDSKAFELQVGENTWKGGTIAKFEPPLTLAKSAGQALKVKFTALDGAVHATTMKIFSNDANSPTTVQLLANKNVPCLKVQPYPTLNFGNVVLGGANKKKLALSSCGTEEVEVTGLDLLKDTGDVFKVGAITALGGKPIGKDNPLKIGKNDTVDVLVTCTPVSENKDPAGKAQPYTAQIAVADNTIDPAKTVALLCQGTNVACPTAIIGTESEEIVPQGQIMLKGSGSVALEPYAVTKWKWEVLKQPAGTDGYLFYPQTYAVAPCKSDGTCPTLAPEAKAADVVFGIPTYHKADSKLYVQANVAGEYTFKLSVWDDANNPSCNSATVTINVVPDTGIHIELLWDTPLDTDKKDSGNDAGSDLDLHFTHPSATAGKTCKTPAELCPNGKPCACQPDLDLDGAGDPWFEATFDCYWFNANPKWGSLTLNADDPGLDLDDTDGAGPENLNLATPENSTKYSVGVHYWDAHNYGDSTATVNIYILGMQKASVMQLMHECDMWWVSQIDWPSGDLLDVPGANLKNGSSGKITPKYGSKLATSLNGRCKLAK